MLGVTGNSGRTIRLIGTLFVVLALSLFTVLGWEVVSNGRSLMAAQRLASLARADAALFNAGNALRLTRGNTQLAVLAKDQPEAELRELDAKADAQLAAAIAAAKASLEPERLKDLKQLEAQWGQTRSLFQQLVLAEGAKPKASRAIAAIDEWYKAVGGVVDHVFDLLRSVSATARLSDPTVGHYLAVRQLAWAQRGALGDECSAIRGSFGTNTPLDEAAIRNVAGMRGAVKRIGDLLADTMADFKSDPTLMAAAQQAREQVTTTLAYRDRVRAALGSATSIPVSAWTADCIAGFGPVIEVAQAAIGGIEKHAAAGESAALRALLVVVAAALCVLLLGGAALVTVRNRLSRPVGTLSAAIGRLAEHDYATPVPAMARADEFGAMATTLEALRNSAAKAEHLAEERAAEQEKRVARATQLDQLVRRFELRVSEMVGSVASAATELEASAETLSGTAEQSKGEAATVSDAAQDANAGLQAVASSAEELASSVAEISRQVARSSEITARASEDVRRSDEIVTALAAGASRIDHVVTLISSIANQTNLLALNATIEASRAGEAGKGFAVVASEVKALAKQTAGATGEIASQIKQIQTSTQQAVETIRAISATIAEVSGTTTSIASAVEEQNAATAEIARNVQNAAARTGAVADTIVGVRHTAEGTGELAKGLVTAAAELSRQAETLSSEVGSFVSDVRAA